MSLGVVLDVALGLAFIFALLAIIASSIQEIIATVLSTRGKVLQDMLLQILSQDPAQPGAAQPVPATAGTPDLATRVLGHPLIGGLGTPNLPAWLVRWFKSTRLPSYVPSGNFATALVETLRDGHDETLAVSSQVSRAIAMLPDDSQIKRTLQAFIVEARGDVDVFRTRVQTWYDDAMDRAGGVYKRYAQYMLLGIGLVLAIVVNADVLAIGDKLWHDKNARDVVSKAAEQYMTVHPQSAPTAAGSIANPTSSATPGAAADSSNTTSAPDITPSLNQVQEAGKLIAQLPIPIGWSSNIGDPTPISTGGWVVLVLRKILGLLLTGFAVSLGAPFWFDMLQKHRQFAGCWTEACARGRAAV